MVILCMTPPQKNLPPPHGSHRRNTTIKKIKIHYFKNHPLDIFLCSVILYLYVQNKYMAGGRKTAGERIASLAILGETVFHADDLANLWNIHNKNTLYTTLKRYTASGLLHRIYNGLYALQSPTHLDPRLLALKALHNPGYISCESVLFDCGIINQPPQEITVVSAISKRFTVAENRCRSRRIPDAYLFNESGIDIHNGVRSASLSRAVCDMLYFYPHKYFDVPSLIDWKNVRMLTRAIEYP